MLCLSGFELYSGWMPLFLCDIALTSRSPSCFKITSWRIYAVWKMPANAKQPFLNTSVQTGLLPSALMLGQTNCNITISHSTVLKHKTSLNSSYLRPVYEQGLTVSRKA